MAGFFRAFTSRQGAAVAGNKTLLADLKRVTHTLSLNASDIPADALTAVAQASNNEEERREIMKHLRECLAEATGKNCRRVYGGLILLETLLKRGSPELMVETAEGHHFDLVQRLSFLEHFDFSDRTVQGMVRTKAVALRKEVLPLLEAAALKDKQSVADPAMETTSTCSPGSTQSNYSAGAASSTGFGSDDVSNVLDKIDTSSASKRMVLNNIVKVGHSDDTTSESECEEGSVHAMRFGKSRKRSTRERNMQSSQVQGYPSSGAQQQAKDPIAFQMPPQPVDLLDF